MRRYAFLAKNKKVFIGVCMAGYLGEINLGPLIYVPEGEGAGGPKTRRRWSQAEQETLLNIVTKITDPKGKWNEIAKIFNSMLSASPVTAQQCWEAWQRVVNPEINRSHLDQEEWLTIFIRLGVTDENCTWDKIKTLIANSRKDWCGMLPYLHRNRTPCFLKNAFRDFMKYFEARHNKSKCPATITLRDMVRLYVQRVPRVRKRQRPSLPVAPSVAPPSSHEEVTLQERSVLLAGSADFSEGGPSALRHEETWGTVLDCSRDWTEYQEEILAIFKHLGIPGEAILEKTKELRSVLSEMREHMQWGELIKRDAILAKMTPDEVKNIFQRVMEFWEGCSAESSFEDVVRCYVLQEKRKSEIRQNEDLDLRQGNPPSAAPPLPSSTSSTIVGPTIFWPGDEGEEGIEKRDEDGVGVAFW